MEAELARGVRLSPSVTFMEVSSMRLTRVWIPAAAFAIAFGAVATAWPQMATESDTTTTTTVPAPSYSSKTVERKTVVNPPPVVVNPPAETSETVTTENNVPAPPAPNVEEKKESKTTIGPLGVSHSTKQEETSDY
jgi:hypothetical protein